jgi:glycosyltransferase involved in cell wall biosynthesis
MPNYNKSEFISSAIESVLTQTMCDLELLVVDDASTDGSAKIVDQESTGDPRVSLIRQQQRKGASHCRNVGIKLSRADTIAFLDSDDVYATNALEAMFRALKSSPIPAVAYSDCWLLDGSGKRLPPWQQRFCTSSGMVLEEFLVHGMAAQSSLMVPKRFFDSIGLYDESLWWGEDTDMILRLARRYPFRFVDEQLYGYRLHPGNTWNKLSSRQRLAMKTPIIEKHFKANIRSLDKETKRIVRRRIVDGYIGAHRYRRAMMNSVSSPGLFAISLSLVSKRLFLGALRRSIGYHPAGEASKNTAGTKGAI